MFLSVEEKDQLLSMIEDAVKSGISGNGYNDIQQKLKALAEEKIAQDSPDEQLRVLADVIAHARSKRPMIFMKPLISAGKVANKSMNNQEMSFLLRCADDIWSFNSNPKDLRTQLLGPKSGM